jgi:HD-GYP domain-containing protein (c-di-GMP phosphodiesterase class II)
MAIKENVLGVKEIDCSDGLNTEDYNQIDPGILDCFPRAEYPVNLFHWKENIRVLSPVYRTGREVDRHLRAKVRDLSEKGLLFFSRNQIQDYAACVACNLDTALDDPNLTWDEKAGVFIGELGRRQEAVFLNPMARELDDLQKAIESLSVYLVEDSTRMAKVVHDVHSNIFPQRRRINASLLALAVYLEMNKGEILLETLEIVALGFFLYDIGMSKVSPMMLSKTQQLTPPEKRTVREHPKVGLEILGKLNLTRLEITEPVIQHHERINGTGYPNKLKDDRIGQLGRIAGVADSYCAMITGSPHRKGIPPINAAAELVTNERQYDQVVCRTLVRFLQTVTK